MNGFENMVLQGKIGEEDFIEYCHKNNLIVEDKTNDKEFQAIDVDFIVNGYYTELKTDNLIDKTGNFPIELIHHRKTGDRNGWYYYTQATYIIRYSRKSKRLYVLYFNKCKDYLLEHFDELDFHNFCIDKQDNNYVTGLLVKVKDLQELGFLRIIDIEQ